MSKKWLLLLSVLLVAAILYFQPILAMFSGELLSEARNKNLHEKTYISVIIPTAEWAKTNYSSNACLPTQDEVDRYVNSISFAPMAVLIYTNSAAREVFGQTGRDFLLCVPIGDWNLFYQSWDGKRFKYWTD